jgi:tetratricopeptide (TPR) repeat protein
LNNVAFIYASQAKNLDQALTLAQKALELAPNNGSVLDTVGFVHYQRGEYAKAEPLLKSASDAQPQNATVAYHLGMTYYKLGRRDDAAAALRRALRLKENLPQAREIQAVLSELKQ